LLVYTAFEKAPHLVMLQVILDKPWVHVLGKRYVKMAETFGD